MIVPAIIGKIAYGALGQVKTKEPSRQMPGEEHFTSKPLEVQDYDYNIRDWLLNVNRADVGDP